MKDSKGTTSFMFLLLFFVTIFFSPLPALAVPIVSTQPAVSTATVGSSFDVFVNISPVTAFYAFQFDITFDPAILSATSVAEGTFLQSGGNFFPGFTDNPSGSITFIANSLIGPDGISGSGTLADIKFLALGPGTSLIDLSNVILLVLLDSKLDDIAFTTTSGSVTVVSGVSVPEPATILLISMGLVALGIVRKKGSEII